MSKNLKLLLLFLAPLSIIAQEVEEVIVTANKKAETVMEIPMNISVITEATLDKRGIKANKRNICKKVLFIYF